jgi:hypothetical protein
MKIGNEEAERDGRCDENQIKYTDSNVTEKVGIISRRNRLVIGDLEHHSCSNWQSLPLN